MGIDLYIDGDHFDNLPVKGSLNYDLIGPVRLLTATDIIEEIEKLMDLYRGDSVRFEKEEIAIAISAFAYALSQCSTNKFDEELRAGYIKTGLCKYISEFRNDLEYNLGYHVTEEKIARYNKRKEEEEKKFQTFKEKISIEPYVFFGCD